MKKTLIFFILIYLTLSACQNTHSNSLVLDEDRFFAVLLDMHLADGIIRTEDLDRKIGNIDSVSLYNDVFIKHKVSRLQFDASVDYYTRHPDDYSEIYKRVIDTIAKRKQDLLDMDRKRDSLRTDSLNAQAEKPDKDNLWKDRRFWSLPADGETNPIAFEIPVQTSGTYVLSAKITLFPDDGTLNQRMTIIAQYADNTTDIALNGAISKNGQESLVEVRITTNPKKTLTGLKGWVLDHSEGTSSKHSTVSDIELKLLKK